DEGATLTRYLHTSPELALKRVLANGVERVYCLSHVFRDGETSPLHLPEFSLLEWYRARAGLVDLVSDCEQLLRELALAFRETTSLPLPNGAELDVAAPFEVRTVTELFE